MHHQQAQPEEASESDQWHHRRAQTKRTHEWDQIYDQLADTEPLSRADPNENSAAGLEGDVARRPQVEARGSFADLNYPEGESVSVPDMKVLIEDRGISDEQDEGRKANGEASYRRGSSVLQ